MTKDETIAALLKLADGGEHKPAEISRVIRLKASARKEFMARLEMLAWLEIQGDGKNGYRFKVDEELRAICQDGAPRPELNGASLRDCIRAMERDLIQERKANNELGRLWNPDTVSKPEQKAIMDRHQARLTQLVDLIKSKGASKNGI